MKRTLRWSLSAVSAAALSLGMLAGPAAAAEWKFALEEVDGSVQDAYAEEFKKRIEKKSGGDVKVNIYPYGTLGTSTQLTELVANGALQFANASPGHLGKLIAPIQVFSIPYLLPKNDECTKQILGSSDVLYESLSDEFANQDLKLLTMYPEGEMVWTANKKITSPEDFNNFKMRVMTSPLLVSAYEAFGANPTPMPYSEVYSGLQLGQIDGQVNPIFAIEEMKFYEVQDYMIWAGQQEFTTTVVANADFYNGLSKERKQLVELDRQGDGRRDLQDPERVQPEASGEYQGVRQGARDGPPVRRAARALPQGRSAGRGEVRRNDRRAGQEDAKRAQEGNRGVRAVDVTGS
ncbi:MAG: TRAP transporter substrate-binding protein DctP [Rhodovibrio sp.]|nr:TRAP transporter substrate-binding protein DctP [Rhodovibrio sp.]